MKRTLKLYRDSKGGFRWNLRAANNRKLANGGEGYQNKAGLLKGLDLSGILDLLAAHDVKIENRTGVERILPEHELSDEGE